VHRERDTVPRQVICERFTHSRREESKREDLRSLVEATIRRLYSLICGGRKSILGGSHPPLDRGGEEDSRVRKLVYKNRTGIKKEWIYNVKQDS